MKRILTIALAGAALLGGVWGLLYLRGGMDAAEAVRKLSGLRLSIELYRQEHKKLPASFADTLKAGTLEEAPALKLPGHFKTSKVTDTPSLLIRDTGGWAYVNNPADPAFGLVYIDSSSKDEKHRFWSEF
jgi:hypothetical protein